MAVLAARKATYADVRVRFLLIWSLGVLVFFSAVPNKLPLYVLPIFPALAIVLSVAWDRASKREWWLAACVIMMALLPSIGAGLPDALRLGARRTQWTFIPSGLLFALVGAGVWWLVRRERLIEGVLLTATAIGSGVVYLKLQALPLLEERDSARSFWRAHHPEIVKACVDRRVPRTQAYGLEYYSGQALPDCENEQSSAFRIEDKGGYLTLKTGL
jgi:4-amino-4-deoxy-L-arabinose transferase-like glycosyltransferase